MLVSARISGQREHKGEIVATRIGPGSQPPRRAPCAARRSRSPHQQERPPLPARRLLRCDHCGEMVVRGRGRWHPPLWLREGPASAAAGRPHQRRAARAVRRRGGPAPARHARARRRPRRSAGEPDGERWQHEVEQAQERLDELAGDVGTARSPGRVGDRPRADREAADTASSRLAKLNRTTVLDRMSATRGAAGALVGADPHPAARSSAPSSTTSPSGPDAAAQPLRRVAPAARLAR